MLQSKTKGNLSDYEEKFLTETLKDLKLNYVDEVDKDKKPASSSTDGKPEGKEEKAEEKK